MKTVKSNQLEGIIDSILGAYSKEVKNTIIESAKEVGEEGKNKLKQTSPKRTGKYRQGWRLKTKEGATFVHCTIHNATRYQLTHLLENGHLNRDGSRTKGLPHIAPVEEYVQKEYVRKVENAIRGGLK